MREGGKLDSGPGETRAIVDGGGCVRDSLLVQCGWTVSGIVRHSSLAMGIVSDLLVQ